MGSRAASTRLPAVRRPRARNACGVGPMRVRPRTQEGRCERIRQRSWWWCSAVVISRWCPPQTRGRGRTVARTRDRPRRVRGTAKLLGWPLLHRCRALSARHRRRLRLGDRRGRRLRASQTVAGTNGREGMRRCSETCTWLDVGFIRPESGTSCDYCDDSGAGLGEELAFTASRTETFSHAGRSVGSVRCNSFGCMPPLGGRVLLNADTSNDVGGRFTSTRFQVGYGVVSVEARPCGATIRPGDRFEIGVVAGSTTNRSEVEITEATVTGAAQCPLP